MDQEQLIKRAFLRGYRTGFEAASLDTKPAKINIHIPDEKPTYKIGQALEDGYLYAGFFQTDKESYHLAIAPKDEEKEMNWHDAMKLDIPNRAEWFFLLVNKKVLNLKDNYYWTSEKYSDSASWLQYSFNGYQYSTDQYDTNSVRQIRRFGHLII